MCGPGEKSVDKMRENNSPHRFEGRLCYCGQDDLRQHPHLTPPSLRQLCSNVIVWHRSLVDIACDVVPSTLYDVIKTAARRVNSQYALERLFVCCPTIVDRHVVDWIESGESTGSVEVTGSDVTEEQRAVALRPYPTADPEAVCACQAYIACLERRREMPVKLRRIVNVDHVLGGL